MARQSALARKQETRRRRPRLTGAVTAPVSPRAQAVAPLRLVGPAVAVASCEITVVYAAGDMRLELHRERTEGRCRWFAVAVIEGELHDARLTKSRWQALAICRDWERG
jgi:hypothetical protein